MRHRLLLILPFLFAATPLTAQQGPPVVDSAQARPDSAAVVEDSAAARKAADIRLRLGLKPIDSPFELRFPPPPGTDLVWLRPRYTDWVGEWRRATESRLTAGRDAIWQRQRSIVRELAAVDTVTYLPPPPPRRQARGGGELLPGVVGEYADIGMVVSGRGELGGNWSRFEPCNPLIQFNCNPGFFPQLKPDVQFGVQVGGTISDRIHINVDYDQRREFDAANNINVYYQGLEDEILQRLEVGDVSIQLPSSRYITQGIPAGNFGFKATGQLGPLDFQAVFAQQKGDVSTREYRLGGTGGSQAGLVQDAEIALDDADYAKGQFFFLVDPDSIAGSPHIDILSLRLGDAPPSLRPAAGSLKVYRDERPSFLNPQQIAQLGYFPAVARSVPGADGPIQHTGTFRLLTLGEDYLVHPSGLWIMLRQPLRPDEALAVTYVTETGEQIGTPNAEQAPSGTTPELRMLRGPAAVHQPGQPTWRFEMHHVYRLDSSNGVDASSVDLRISLGELAAGGTFVEFGGQQISYLKLFGLDEDAPADRIDASHIYQPGRDAFGGTADARIGGTYIVFPTLRPFAEPPPVPSAGLSAEDARAVLGADANAAIYDNPDPVIRENASRFRLSFKYRVRIEGLVSSFNLGAFGIREESERIFVDGKLLQRNVDYEIDYDLGLVTLRDAQGLFAANPDAEIRATWEQKAAFQIAPTSVFGMNTRYRLGQRGELNFMGLYQSEKSLMSRPQLGLEPSAIFMGGANGRLDLGVGWLDRVLEKVPGLRLGSQSSANLTGEVAMSLPNPNTRGNTYLDDFEGSDEIRLGLDRHLWRLGSRMEDPTGALDVLPLPLESFNAARITWQDYFLSADGQIVGPTTPEGIDRQINVAGTAIREPVLYITLGDTSVAPGEKRWRSLTTVLSTTGRDMTRSEYFEFYVAHDPSREVALIFDFGTVSEDAFYFDAEGRTNGTYEDGREWGLGVLDEEARLSEREIWSFESDARGLWDQDCEGALDRAFPLGDGNANCTRNNGRVDTEDLDGNGLLDATDGPIHRFVVRLDGSSPYLVRDTLATGTVFSLYRIPLRGSGAIPLPGANAGSWRYVKHLRMTLVAEASGGTIVALARPRIIGSRWTKRDASGIMAGLISDEPGLGAGATRFEVGPVSRLTDGSAYASPPGVRDQLQDPTSAFGLGSTEFNEKALRLRYEGLEPDERAEVYFRYPQESRNFMSYRQLRLWAVAREGNWGPQGTQRLVVKVGTDQRNYYLFQTPLREAVSDRGVDPSDWLPELVIDFERWFELRALAEQELIINPRTDGEPLVVWSADSAYAVVLEDRGRAPNLSAVREISFAVYNAGPTPIPAGEVWINDMRLAGAVTDPGFAGHLTLDVRGGDFITASVGYSGQGAYFRQLNQDASYLSRGDLSVATSVQLGNLLPSSLGVDLPVVVNHTRGGMQPTFLERSDVRADHLQGLRRTSNESTRIGVSLRKRTPSANPLVGLLVDGTQLQFGYNTGSTSSVVSSSEARGINARATYARTPGARQIDAVPGVIASVLRGIAPESLERSEFFQRLIGARLRWSPEVVSFSSGYFGNQAQTYRYDRILETPEDTLIAPVESETRGLTNEARIAFRPFQSLAADVAVNSTRDLLPATKATTRPHEREAIENARAKFAGADIGWETGRSVNSSITFRPTVTDWLRPGFSYTTQFRTDRNPSYVEFIPVGASDSMAVMQRRFQASRQVTQTLLVEPTGLAQALFGPRRADEGLLRGAAFRLIGAVQPLDLSWSSTVGSQFERETFMPGLRYQLGRGDLESFRIIQGDTAASAQERDQFRARSGLRLPLGMQVAVAYATAGGTSYDLRGGDTRNDDRTWPDVRLTWQSIPLPQAVRQYVTHVSVTSGFQSREVETERFGGFIEQRTIRRDRSIPLQVSLSTAAGITASYSGSRARGEVRDATGDAESSSNSHSVQLSASFMPPEHMRDKLMQPVMLSLRYTYNDQQQCRARGGSADEPAVCVPIVDVLNRSLNLTIDTVISDLNVGLQMSYTDQKNFVGTRNGSSQFQFGLFGQFYFTAGSLGAGGWPGR